MLPGVVRGALLGLGALVLVVFAGSVDRQDLRAAFAAQWHTVVVVIGILAIDIVLKALRWKWMIALLTGKTISIPFAVASIPVGVAGGSIFPGRGLEMGKPLMLTHVYGISLSRSMAAMIVERVADFSAVAVVLGASALALGSAARPLSAAAALVLLVVLALGALSAMRGARGAGSRRDEGMGAAPQPLQRRLLFRLREAVETVFSAIAFWRRPRLAVRLGALSLAAWSLECLRFYLVLRAFGLTVPLAISAVAFTGALLAGVATLIPGGIGVTEVSEAVLIGLLIPELAGSAAVRSAVLLDRVLSYYLVAVLGAVILIALSRRKSPAAAAQVVSEQVLGR